jgi:streptomycin 6-kinase
MSPLTIPENLARDIGSAGSAARMAWLQGLPDDVERLTARWSLTIGEPYRPGGSCSWVAPVATSAGEQLVLKVAWAHEEAMHEADGLRAWDGVGAVRLHAEERSAHTSAMLLERCVPGATLGEIEVGPRQDLVVAGLLQRLWITPPADRPFRPLELMCEQWAREAEEALERRPGTLEPAVAREGIAMFRELSKTPSRPALLCTDLHAENVLAAGREPWLAIDPKPYVGDPAYDPLQHMLNCPERLHDDPRGLASRMARLTGLDPERVSAWLFARCVQESPDAPQLAGVAKRLATEALP